MAYQEYNPKTGVTTNYSSASAIPGLSANQVAMLNQGTATQNAVNASNYNIMQRAGATPAQTFATMGGTAGSTTIGGLNTQQNIALAQELSKYNESIKNTAESKVFNPQLDVNEQNAESFVGYDPGTGKIATLANTPENRTASKSFEESLNSTGLNSTRMPKATEAPISSSMSPGAGYIKGYDTNNNFAPVWVKAGMYYPGISLYPKKEGGITADSLNKEKSVTVPGVDPGKFVNENGLNQYDIITGTEAAKIQADIKARQELLKATMTDEQKQDETLGKQLQSLIPQLAGKSAYENEMNAKYIDPLEQKLTSINNEIEAKNAEKERLLADVQGKPITMNSIIGSQAQVRAVLNAEILTLTAQANAIMGNITDAKTQVTRAVNAKYAPIEEAISIAQAQREALSGTLTKQEQIQKEALDRADAAKLQAISDAKELETTAQNYVLDLMAKYPDANINLTDSISAAQSKISGSKIYQQGTRLAGVTPDTTTPTTTTPEGKPVNPVVDSYANDLLDEKISISNVPEKLRSAVQIRKDELALERAKAARPQTVEAIQKIIADARSEGYSNQEIIDSFVEDFGWNRDSATRLVKINN